MAKKDIIKRKKNEVIHEAKIDGINYDDPKFSASIIMLITTSVLIILSLVSLYFHFDDKASTKKLNNDNSFKKEYEQYNNKKTETGNSYLNVNITSKNIIKYSSYDEIYEILDNGTGVIYFGFPTCPWCRNLVEPLLDAASEVGIEKIYYLNNKDDRDIKSLNENGEVVTEKEGTKDYYKLLKKLDKILGVYKGLNDNTIKRLYFPTVLFVKDGKIMDYQIGTIPSQENPYVPLTSEEYKELKDILVSKFNKILICDESC